jgi:putative oxidoreductase
METPVPLDARDAFWIVGRALLAAPFVVGGIGHFFHFSTLAQVMGRRGVPAARFVLVCGSVLQIAAGTALIFGFHPPYAIAALIVFTLTASLMFLNFWSMEGAERTNAINAWWANIGIMGGLLVVAAHVSRAGAL